jgi:hypothetical protein
MPTQFIPSGDFHYSDDLQSWIWWEIWDDGKRYEHRWNEDNNTTEWLDVPNRLWHWKANGKQVPADALAHYEANQKKTLNKRFYTDDKAYLDEPLRWNGIILHMNGWNADGSPKYWNGQGKDPGEHNIPLGLTGSRDPERLRFLDARRQAHQDYAYQQAVPAKGWTVDSTSPMWQPRYGGQKRVTNRRRRNKSIRRRRNKSIRRRRN